jgi:hypothetical protein
MRCWENAEPNQLGMATPVLGAAAKLPLVAAMTTVAVAAEELVTLYALWMPLYPNLDPPT